ncbi:MAG TPA: transglycosylase domain-containing protein [Solirubrobacteraceae bacterium]|nr:transglycosylase domain-containing protein [Solirubrobacteraceae bacterium]
MSRQARQRRRQHRRGGGKRMLIIGGAVATLALLGGAIAAVAYVVKISDRAPNPERLKAKVSGGTSQVYSADGTRLGFIQSDELRTPIGWNLIPKNLANATVAIEDQRFYKHDGVDVTGIVRAAVKDVTHGKVLQGGSTITMQLMRNLYLGNDHHTFEQKIEEAKMALEYEKHHSKQQTLTNYLNSVPYGTVGGQTMLGVQAAARIFFSKPASALNLAQCALLAGLPQAPSQYNPFADRSEALQRRNEVLGKMAELHYISNAEAHTAEGEGLQVHLGRFYSERKEDFFFEYVRELLVHRYGETAVKQGGLKVYTTIDLRMQGLARKAIAEILDEPGDPASAVVTIDPANGDIEAMAESESYEKSQYNLASDGHRQPGSTFKAIVLADALSKGVDPNTTIYDSHKLNKGWLPEEPEYEVEGFGGEAFGASNLVTATLHSDNTVYAQLAADLGEESVTQMAYKLGVKEHLLGNPAQALGGLKHGVTPLEMANVYATFADGGIRNTPIAITKVVFPDGKVDTNWGKPHRERAITEPVAGELTAILHQNVLGGTAGRSEIDCPTAAKTGTTNDLIDAWLDGYNEEFATAVWMGYPNTRVEMTDVHGEPQQGGFLPAEIWHAYMAPVTEGKPCAPLKESSTGIEYAPFYGKYAATGEALAAKEAAEGTKTPHKHHEKTPPNEAPPPTAGVPPVNETGGASPGQ